VFRTVASALAISALVIAGCADQDSSPLGGEKQTWGTLLGGAFGGLLGSQFGHGSGAVAATGAGVVLGAVLGNYVGAKLDARDKEAASHAMDQALSQPGTQRVAWNNAQSGNHGTIVAKPAHYETHQVEGAGGAASLQPPPANPVPVDPVWVAPSGAKLHAAPDLHAATIGHLRAGRNFEVAGQVPNSDWVIVTRQGQPVGYVSTTVARPVSASGTRTASAGTTPALNHTPSAASQQTEAAPARVTEADAPVQDTQQPAAGTSKAEAAGSSAASADSGAIELGGTGHTVRVACRSVVSSVNLQGQQQADVTESKVCQKPDGSWAPTSS
jgi:surface antigen